MVDEHDDLPALRRLSHEMDPPPHVRANLRANLFANSRENRRINLWYGAVAASIVIAAFTAGRITAPPPAPAPAGQKFALLLYGGGTGGGDDRAAEYGAWAVAARRAGRAVSGERLADAAFVAGAAVSDPAPLRGFFIVQATNAAEALELAKLHPHARDGTVVVRPIDTP
jgi:hypothetical protein